MYISRIITVFLFLWPTGPGLAAEDSVAETTQTADPSAQHTTPRFEGYLFLDIEGRPLPIQTDAEIEAWLARAEIVRVQPVPTGVTMPRKLLLKGDTFEAHAIFKDVDISRRKVSEIINGRNHFSFDWKDSYQFDIAAYKLDRLLGMDRVPPVVPRDIGRDSGGVSIWLGKTINEFERSRQWKVDPPDRRRWNQQRLIMQIFDNLVANRDSNLGNQLIDPNWRLWFIDCSRCFGATKTIYFPLKTISQCERGLWQGLKSLTESEIRESLAPLLGRAEIDALLTRRDKLVQHFQKLIDERGEAAVLYDVDPPSVTAPWGDD
jgi:hypothetical protein